MIEKKSRKRLPPGSEPAEEEAAGDLLAAEAGGLSVVGVGASAGGLEAFTQLLRGLPDEPGFAVVFVQHLAPQHDSALPVLLAGATHLPVVLVEEGMPLAANHIYVIPPNAQLSLVGHTLHLGSRPKDHSQYTPIDFFFRSLAEEMQSRAIGVVLSGTAHDGSLGVREIKAVGGVTIAQTPETARFDGMPRAAIATDAIDLVLPPEEIGKELVRIARHPDLQYLESGSGAQQLSISEDQLQRIFGLLRLSSGVDFAHYKPSTIKRRLQRRMALGKLSTVDEYLDYLEKNPTEISRLFHDVLIQVTRFFREPESFEALSKQVIGELLEHRGPDQPVRIWIPGCASGEEAYSVAIALLEAMRERSSNASAQILALPFSGVIAAECGLDAAGEGVQVGNRAMGDAAEPVDFQA
ncbi:MAG TPA: chemotaxis protein CheB [Pirellulales bacterium]|nr:chemotaxis protein CheB [Pirellulales bacterium]